MAKKSGEKKKRGFFSRKAKEDSSPPPPPPTVQESLAASAQPTMPTTNTGVTTTRIRTAEPSPQLKTNLQVVDASATDSSAPRVTAGLTNAVLEAAGERIQSIRPMTPTLDENLWTGSRIMVPVDVQALVVPNTALFDRDSESPKSGNSSSSDKSSPVNYGGLESGIHLHWAMPDGLLSEVPSEEEEDGYVDSLPEDAQIGEEMPINAEDVEIELHPLPDRWLVTRFWPASYYPTDETTQLKRVENWNTQSWVINAADATRNPLSTWRAPPLRETEWPKELTALGPDVEPDPYWTARYDSVLDRFTFHDVPPPHVVGPLNYLVCGWYSDHREDPLWFPDGANMDDWEERMSELEWNVYEQLIWDTIGVTRSRPTRRTGGRR